MSRAEGMPMWTRANEGKGLIALALLLIAACAGNVATRPGRNGLDVRLVVEPGQAKPDGEPLTVEWKGSMLDLAGANCFAVSEATAVSTGAQYGVTFELAESDRSRFKDFTAKYVGRMMAVLVDGETLEVARIMAPLPAAGMLTGPGDGWEKSKAEQIARALLR